MDEREARARLAAACMHPFIRSDIYRADLPTLLRWAQADKEQPGNPEWTARQVLADQQTGH